MTRLPLLGLAGVLFAAAPANAQTPADSPMMADSTMMADPMMADTSVARVVDTPRAARLNSEAVDLEESNQAGALALYEQALEADSTYPAALLGRGNMLSQLGRNEEARVSYMAAAAAADARGRSFDAVGTMARTNAGLVTDIIAEEAEAARLAADADQQAASVAVQADAIGQASTLLAQDPFTPEVAQQVYDQLERAREAGYDASLVAFQYARSLNTLGRGADALPYAQQALDATTDADKSAYYVQLGLAQRLSGNDAAARTSFTQAKTGSWAGWADYYINEMDVAAATP